MTLLSFQKYSQLLKLMWCIGLEKNFLSKTVHSKQICKEVKFLRNKTVFMVEYGKLQKITVAKVLLITNISRRQKSYFWFAKLSELFMNNVL